MTAFTEESLNERDNQYNTDEINYSRFTDTATPDPDDDLVDDDDDLDPDLDDDTLDDDTEFDDDDFDDDLDEDEDLDEPIAGIRAEGDGDSLNENEESDPNLTPDETPEQGESDNEDLRYPKEAETNPQTTGGEQETSWSEQIDVNPPEQHGFPTEGPSKANFEARPHGRTTGRIIGDDPGTEGI